MCLGRGHVAVVKLLLQYGGIETETGDYHDNLTPLSIAVERGQERVVKLLLGREGVDPKAVDGEGQTRLHSI